MRARAGFVSGRSTRTTSSRSDCTWKSRTICPVMGSKGPSSALTMTRRPSPTMRSSCSGRVTRGRAWRRAPMARATSRRRTRCSSSSRVARRAMRSWNVYARCLPFWPDGETTLARSSDRRRVSVTPSSLATSRLVKRSVTGSRPSGGGGMLGAVAPFAPGAPGAPFPFGPGIRPPLAPKATWITEPVLPPLRLFRLSPSWVVGMGPKVIAPT